MRRSRASSRVAPVNAGDIVTPGAELFTVVDPSSMRLEASVPSESLSELRVGAPVEFQVRGYEQAFDGRLERIAPQTDAATRQLPIYVAIPNTGGRLVGGLFAEGRVVTQSATGLVVPVNAVNTTGPTPWVLRVVDGRAERVDVTLGLRDPQDRARAGDVWPCGGRHPASRRGAGHRAGHARSRLAGRE